MAQIADDAVGRRAARPRAHGLARRKHAAVPFPELVHLHNLWREALEANDPRLHELDDRYHRARAAFEKVHGEIVGEYWCWKIPSGVVLTVKPPAPWLGLIRSPTVAFHRASDWATKDRPEIAAQVHRCDDLAAKATQVLTGVRERICMQLVLSSAAHLLSLVDARDAEVDEGAADDAKANVATAIEHERATLDRTEEYYRDAANGQAQIVYFTGMAFVAAILGLLALCGWLWIGRDNDVKPALFGCFAAGAIGAVVSVIARVNSGRFELDFDVGRPYVRFLGGLRPVIGAAFGLVIYFAVAGNYLNIFQPKGSAQDRLYEFLVIAFLAGFSERWAQDTLTSLAPMGAAAKTPSPPSATSSRPKNSLHGISKKS